MRTNLALKELHVYDEPVSAREIEQVGTLMQWAAFLAYGLSFAVLALGAFFAGRAAVHFFMWLSTVSL
jgi:hypothetical protein